MSRAAAILEAAIRRRRRAYPNHPLDGADLVCFTDPGGHLGGAEGPLKLTSGVWRVIGVRGELSLREALLDPTPVVVVLPVEMTPPHDILERQWLRRPLQVAAEDVVEAATGRLCQPLTDARVCQAVLADVERFFERAQTRRWISPSVREAEIVELLQEDGTSIQQRSTPELLAGWMVDGPPGETPLLRAALRDAHFEYHDWLMTACTEEGLSRLVTAGALAPCRRLRPAAQFDEPSEADVVWQRLERLVGRAVRLALEQSETAERWLGPAERLAGQYDLGLDEALGLSLLVRGFHASVTALVAGFAEGRTPGQAALDRLERHRAADRRVLDTTEALARLTRYVTSDRSASTVSERAAAHLHGSGWADVCARDVRRGLTGLPEEAQPGARRVLDLYRAHRDHANRQFAEQLATDEASQYGRRAAGDGMSLHLVTSELVLPIAREERVLLVVLDGCDVAAFHELLDDLLEQRPGIGLGRRPGLTGAAKALPTLCAALSPLPTLTQVGRRAIFAGEIPDNAVLTDQENAAANARSDKAAFNRNRALAEVDKQLFLKGDLGDGRALLEALSSDTRVVAVVFNEIDDALSGRGVTVSPRWRVDRIHDVLGQALRCDRQVVLTSDHGHTPFWTAERKVPADVEASQRFTAGPPPPGAVRLGSTPWRAGELHVLTDMGAYVSIQRTGYHGGASLEEVVVPVALLATGGHPAPTPDWWAHVATSATVEVPVHTPEPEVRAAWEPAVTRTLVPLIKFLDAHGEITEADASRLANKRAFRKLDSTLRRLKKKGLLDFEWTRNTVAGMSRIVKRT